MALVQCGQQTGATRLVRGRHSRHGQSSVWTKPFGGRIQGTCYCRSLNPYRKWGVTDEAQSCGLCEQVARWQVHSLGQETQKHMGKIAYGKFFCSLNSHCGTVVYFISQYSMIGGDVPAYAYRFPTCTKFTLLGTPERGYMQLDKLRCSAL